MLLFIGVPTSTGVVFLYCYVGSLTTDQFLRFGNIAYESEWFKMTVEQQKLIQLIIADAQRPLVFHGLQLINLNLEAFGKVNFNPRFSHWVVFTLVRFQIMRTVVSYVMVLRSLPG